MYHLTPIEAMIIVAIFVIVFIAKGAKRKFDSAEDYLCKSKPEFREAHEWGYSYMYCQEMKKRDMIFKNGRWVPKGIENDVNSKELQELMRKKDLELDYYKQWVFTGKTLEKLRMYKALPWQ